MNRCDKELVDKILAEDSHINVRGLDIAIKSIPDDDREGVLDKREFFIRNAIFLFINFNQMKNLIDLLTFYFPP